MITRPQPASTTAGAVHHVWADAGMGALAAAAISIAAAAARVSNIFFTITLRSLGLRQLSFQATAAAAAAPRTIGPQRVPAHRVVLPRDGCFLQEVLPKGVRATTLRRIALCAGCYGKGVAGLASAWTASVLTCVADATPCGFLGSASGRISGVVKVTPSGLGFGVGVTTVW